MTVPVAAFLTPISDSISELVGKRCDGVVLGDKYLDGLMEEYHRKVETGECERGSLLA